MNALTVPANTPAAAAYQLAMSVVGLLFLSNIFMTFAWYGHLRFAQASLWKVILVSWAIAFLEYLFMIPANRIGAGANWSAFQLKITQEAITLIVFTGFAAFYLKERPSWNNALALVLVMGAVFLTFGFKGAPRPVQPLAVAHMEQNTK